MMIAIGATVVSTAGLTVVSTTEAHAEEFSPNCVPTTVADQAYSYKCTLYRGWYADLLAVDTNILPDNPDKEPLHITDFTQAKYTGSPDAPLPQVYLSQGSNADNTGSYYYAGIGIDPAVVDQFDFYAELSNGFSAYVVVDTVENPTPEQPPATTPRKPIVKKSKLYDTFRVCIQRSGEALTVLYGNNKAPTPDAQVYNLKPGSCTNLSAFGRKRVYWLSFRQSDYMFAGEGYLSVKQRKHHKSASQRSQISQHGKNIWRNRV